MVTKATFVGPGFTRKPPKYERFIRPMGLRFNKVSVLSAAELRPVAPLRFLTVSSDGCRANS